MENNVDWNLALTKETDAPVKLADAEMEEEITFTFTRVFQTESGAIGAEVETDLDGSVLWLNGKYGPSNGLHSLIAAVGGTEKIVGSTVIYVRVPSDKNPNADYAHSWRVA